MTPRCTLDCPPGQAQRLGDDRLLGELQSYLVRSGVEIPPWKHTEEERARFEASVAKALVELRLPIDEDRLPSEARRLTGMMLRVGVLTPLLDEEGVEEIFVRDGHVLVERRGRIEYVGQWSNQHFDAVATRVADLGKRAMSGQRPYVLVDLPDGHRFTAIKPDLSVKGVAINVRVFPKRKLTLEDLVERGALPEHVAAFLRDVVENNLATILVSGEFGSGKTTLLNALTAYVPPTSPVAVIETFQELQPAHPHPVRTVVAAQSEETPGQPSMRDVVNLLYTRMRPDLVLIGEIVADEAVEFLKAINLGMRGMSTIHGDSPLDALYRLEVLALEGHLPIEVSRELAAAAINLVVHTRRAGPRRFVSDVVRVDGLDADGRYRLVPVYQAEHASRSEALMRLWSQATSSEGRGQP
jgi:pilus assembly protein CpaF